MHSNALQAGCYDPLSIPSPYPRISSVLDVLPNILLCTIFAGPHGTYACVGAYLQEPVPAEAPRKYDWARQWYPLAFVEDLDPTRPHPMELLGKRIVLWRDSSKQWRCFEDRCPHRLAPLSGSTPFLSVHTQGGRKRVQTLYPTVGGDLNPRPY